MGLLNRLIVEDLLLYDQQGEELLKVPRLSIRFDILPLLKGRISISSVQLFGCSISLSQAHPKAAPNYQFLIEALSSKEESQDSNLDLRINSILIRRGNLSHHLQSEKETPHVFNPHHLHVQNLLANLSLKTLSNDSINIGVKRLSFSEAYSGFGVKRLQLKLTANHNRLHLDDLILDLPESRLQIDSLGLSYRTTDLLKGLPKDMHFSLKAMQSSLTLRDLSAFVPSFSQFKEPLHIQLSAQGTPDNIRISELAIASDDDNFRLRAEINLQDLFHPTNTYVYGQLSELTATQSGLGFMSRNLIANYNGVPPMLARMGFVDFRGEISGFFTDLVTYGKLRTSLGETRMDMKFTIDKAQSLFAYSGSVKTEKFQLGKLLNSPLLGETALNLSVTGKHLSGQKPDIDIQGQVLTLDYNGYRYENITINGAYKAGNAKGELALHDPNGNVQLIGEAKLSATVPHYQVYACVEDLHPHALRLTSAYEGGRFSGSLRADLAGKNLEDLNGEINIDSLSYRSPKENYQTSQIHFKALQSKTDKHLSLTSDFLTASVNGTFQYKHLLTSFLKALKSSVPSLGSSFDLPTKSTDNHIKFNLQVRDVKPLPIFLQIPLELYMPAQLKGEVDDLNGYVHVEGHFPKFRYGKNLFESAMLLCEQKQGRAHAKIRATQKGTNDAINIAIESQAFNDSIHTNLRWGNTASSTYSGELSTLAAFSQLEAEKKSGALRTHIHINPTQVILNDTTWRIHPSQITIDPSIVRVDNFRFSHEERHLQINGILSNQQEDTLKIGLQDIHLGYVFNLIGISGDADLTGDVSGTAIAHGLLKSPFIRSNLKIRNLAFNRGRLGNATVRASWDQTQRGLFLQADIENENKKTSRVSGAIFPLTPESGLDLHIDAEELNLKFLEYYLSDIATDIRGHGTGKVRLYGQFDKLTLDGAAMADASMYFDVLNTRFAIKDSVRLHPSGISFKDARIADAKGNVGKGSGEVTYRHFKDINYRFEILANNFLVFDLKETPDLSFYGSVYGSGSAVIMGNETDGLSVEASMRTEPKTVFTYIDNSATAAVGNRFIRFVDKTPTSRFSPPSAAEKTSNENEQTADIRLNLLIDLTPSATVRIIMDPNAGDVITCQGNGNIRTEFYNKGDVKLFGDYHIEQGVYKFSLQEVIRKDFMISNGSSIAFRGMPYDAHLNIHAYHTVNSASLNDLIPDLSSSSTGIQTNVRVNCLMNLTGNLLNPTIKLGLELPNEREEVQSLVRNYISTDEQMNMQILYLLGIGKFYADNTLIDGNRNSTVMSSVLSSTLSGQLNNALSRIFETSDWNLGTNLSTGDQGWTDLEVEGILSGRLLNNRLLINGNFGYRENPLTNTNFIGDFKAEWLLNRSGNIRLKAYNETNERYYIKNNLTTQGIGIMYKKDFDRWSDLLFFKPKRIKLITDKSSSRNKVNEKRYPPIATP